MRRSVWSAWEIYRRTMEWMWSTVDDAEETDEYILGGLLDRNGQTLRHTDEHQWHHENQMCDAISEMFRRTDSDPAVKTDNEPKYVELISVVPVIIIWNRMIGPPQHSLEQKFWFKIKIKYPLPPTTRPIHDLLNSSTIQISTDGGYLKDCLKPRQWPADIIDTVQLKPAIYDRSIRQVLWSC